MPLNPKRIFVTCCSGDDGMVDGRAWAQLTSVLQVESVFNDGLLTAFQDISAMEEEKDQLMKRVERLKKRVSRELAQQTSASPEDWQRFRNANKDEARLGHSVEDGTQVALGKGNLQAGAQNFQGPGVGSLAVVSGEYCLPKGNDKWMSESPDLLMPFSNVTVTCTTYSLTVGGDCSESSADA